MTNRKKRKRAMNHMYGLNDDSPKGAITYGVDKNGNVLRGDPERKDVKSIGYTNPYYKYRKGSGYRDRSALGYDGYDDTYYTKLVRSYAGDDYQYTYNSINTWGTKPVINKQHQKDFKRWTRRLQGLNITIQEKSDA
jgi:hypothetical protein